MFLRTFALLVGAGLTTAALSGEHIPNAGIQVSGLQHYGCVDGNVEAGMRLLYVVPGGTGVGTRASPYGSLQQAINSAGSQSATVCVASGLFTESLDLGTQRSTLIVGAFNTGFTARAPLSSPTTLRPAQPSQNIVTAQASRRLLLDGLELTGSHGWAVDDNLWDTAPPNTETVTVRNCHIHHNGDGSGGGGVALGGGSYVQIELANNVIEYNDGDNFGAGISVGGDHGNTLVRGSQNDGFGAVTAVAAGRAIIRYNIVRANRIHASGLPHGAGLAIAMNAMVEQNEFIANDTIGDGSHYGVGGGLIAQHGTSADSTDALIVVRGNWFEGNRADKQGSAVFFDQTHAGSLLDNVIVRNTGPSAVLVDGACSDSCAGPSGNYDRNFLTAANNTVADNTGAAFAVQDSTAHLYLNVAWRNANGGGDILLLPGSPGAENILRGRDNFINSTNPSLQQTVSSAGVVNALTDQWRLDSGVASSLHLSSDNATFTPALNAVSDLVVSHASEVDFAQQSRSATGPTLFGAFATTSSVDLIFRNGFDSQTP